MYKNRAVVGFPFGLVSRVDGSAVTAGGVTGYYTLDGGEQYSLSDAPVHEGNGQYTVNLSAMETNGNWVGLTFIHATAVPVHFSIETKTAAGAAITWTYTLTDSVSGLPISDADVWVTTDLAGTNVIAKDRTNAFGIVTFFLDAGLVYVWRQKSGYTFANPDIETVS